MSKTKLLTFSAMLTAIAFVIMLLGSLFDVLDVTAACLASFAVVLVTAEAGYPWAVMTYAAASALSLLIPANKTPAVFFAAFFGIYAIVRFLIQKIRPVGIRWLIKLLSFNAMAALGFVLWRFVFTVGTLKDVPAWIVAVCAVLAQAVFVLYDTAMGRLINVYLFRYHFRVSSFFRKK